MIIKYRHAWGAQVQKEHLDEEILSIDGGYTNNPDGDMPILKTGCPMGLGHDKIWDVIPAKFNHLK